MASQHPAEFWSFSSSSRRSDGARGRRGLLGRAPVKQHVRGPPSTLCTAQHIGLTSSSCAFLPCSMLRLDSLQQLRMAVRPTDTALCLPDMPCLACPSPAHAGRRNSHIPLSQSRQALLACTCAVLAASAIPAVLYGLVFHYDPIQLGTLQAVAWGHWAVVLLACGAGVLAHAMGSIALTALHCGLGFMLGAGLGRCVVPGGCSVESVPMPERVLIRLLRRPLSVPPATRCPAAPPWKLRHSLLVEPQ